MWYSLNPARIVNFFLDAPNAISACTENECLEGKHVAEGKHIALKETLINERRFHGQASFYHAWFSWGRLWAPVPAEPILLKMEIPSTFGPQALCCSTSHPK
eukprot:EG_transcript_52161